MQKDYLDFTYYEMPVEERRKLDVGDIYDNKAKCRKCGWIIRSRNRHDFVSCKCRAISVDGGSWYLRRLGNSEDIIELSLNFKHVE